MNSAKYLGSVAALLISTASLATHFPEEPTPPSAQEQDCSTMCNTSYDTAWANCEYLPARMGEAVVAQCRREVGKKIENCIDRCVNK